jgi:virginiamycin B lyase
MRMAVDHEGRVWFGEMGVNALADFDPRTQTFQQMTPPDGRSWIMGIQVASDDTIWFAEQYANYIGHYFPATGGYQIYHLPTLTVPDSSSPGKLLTLPSAPNDLAIDSHDNIWFTELNAGAIGKLDPQTGHLTQYPLAGRNQAQQLTLYGITVDAYGLVWFTEVSTNLLGRLDPSTGKITYFTQPDATQALMEIVSGKNGIIWITSFSANALLRLEPHTGSFTTYHANPPTPSGAGVGGLYGLVVSPTDAVWVTVLAENILARLDVTTGHFTYYPIPTPNSEPLALASGANRTLWFSEIDKLGMLRP